MVTLTFRDIVLLVCAEEFVNEWMSAPTTAQLTVLHRQWLERNRVGTYFDQPIQNSSSTITKCTSKLRDAGLMMIGVGRGDYMPTLAGQKFIAKLPLRYEDYPLYIDVENGVAKWNQATKYSEDLYE